MSVITKNQLISDLAYDVVAELAPKELPMFKARSAAYFRDPDRVVKSKSGKDEMLGFGVEIAAPILTPTILALATSIIGFILEAANEPFQKGAKVLIGDTVTDMFRKIHPMPEGTASSKGEIKGNVDKARPLTPDQLTLIRKQTVHQALQMGISQRTAEILADALLGRLAVAKQ